MVRIVPLALLVLCAFGEMSSADDGDCCDRCGCRMHCQVMCEWKTYEVRRYKVEHTECPPSGCVCCDDRWIIGCPKPIKVMKLKPHCEKRKKLVRQYVVRTCPQCDHQDTAPVPEK